MSLWIMCLVGVLGAMFGSFAGAQVWRLRARQLKEDAAAGELVDKKELQRLQKITGVSIKNDRSRCLQCGYVLRWHDLIPVVSWLWVRGKCRYCRVPIGWMEIILEVGLATAWVLSVLAWTDYSPLGILALGVWLSGLVCLAILTAYDARWLLLPDLISFIFIGLATAFAALSYFQGDFSLISLCGALLILPGLYLCLYLVSRGRWVGFGDVKLGVGLALFLGNWQLALVALFLANALGSLVAMPLLALKKISRTDTIPFGPFLILGFFLSWLLQGWIFTFFHELLML